MTHFCYILHSKKLNKFYTGYTSSSTDDRLNRHLSDYYGAFKFSHNTNDWVIFLEISCEKKCQALLIESHIKKMKSKVYIQNLIKYPEIIQKLKEKYSSCD